MYDDDMVSRFGHLWPSSDVFYWTIMAVGVAGNCLVLIVVFGFSRMQNVVNIYLCNLAVVNLISVLTVPVLVNHVWEFDTLSCRFYNTGSLAVLLAGAFTVAFLTADKCNSLGSSRPPEDRCLTTVALINVLLWVMSGLFAAPLACFTETKFDNHGRKQCRVNWPDMEMIPGSKVKTVYITVIGCLVPFLFTFLFQTLMICKADKSNSSKCNRRRSTFLVICVTTFYVFSRLPYWIAFLYKGISGEMQSNYWDILVTTSTILVYFNSAFTPIMSAIVNKDFCTSYCRVFTCGVAGSRSGHGLQERHRSFGSGMEPCHSFVFQNDFEQESNKPKIFIDFCKEQPVR